MFIVPRPLPRLPLGGLFFEPFGRPGFLLVRQWCFPVAGSLAHVCAGLALQLTRRASAGRPRGFSVRPHFSRAIHTSPGFLLASHCSLASDFGRPRPAVLARHSSGRDEWDFFGEPDEPEEREASEAWAAWEDLVRTGPDGGGAFVAFCLVRAPP